jgi:hypothetical protein
VNSFRIQIRNFRRVVAADLELRGPATLLIGGNAVGKTSTLRALGAALARAPRLHGATKSDAGPVLHDPRRIDDTATARAADFAAVVVEKLDEGGVIGVCKATWPDQQIAERGHEPPHASVYAANIGSPFGQSWLPYLESVLPEGCPDEATIGDALTEVGISALEASDIAEQLASGQQTWDQASEEMVEKSRAAQRAWRQVTGSPSYGDVIGASWRPKAWVPDLEDVTEAEVREELSHAMADVVRTAQRGVAAAAGRLNRQRDKALQSLQVERRAAEERLMKPLRAEMAEAERWLETLRQSEPHEQKTLECAHCGKPNVLTHDSTMRPLLGRPPAAHELEAAMASHKETVKAAEKRRAAAQQALIEAVSDERDKTPTEVELEREIADLDQQIAGLGNEPEESPEMVAARRRQVELELQLEMVAQVRHAGEHHDAVQAYRAGIELLAPTGLRRELMVSEIERTLQPWLDEHAPWLFGDASVKVDTTVPTIPLLVYGETYEQLAWGGDPNSVALRMRYLAQLFAAVRDGSDIVLLDRADTLVNAAQASLVGLIKHLGLTALVAMTSRHDARAAARQLATELGCAAYVIDAGRTEEAATAH